MGAPASGSSGSSNWSARAAAMAAALRVAAAVSALRGDAGAARRSPVSRSRSRDAEGLLTGKNTRSAASFDPRREGRPAAIAVHEKTCARASSPEPPKARHSAAAMCPPGAPRPRLARAAQRRRAAERRAIRGGGARRAPRAPLGHASRRYPRRTPDPLAERTYGNDRGCGAGAPGWTRIGVVSARSGDASIASDGP